MLGFSSRRGERVVEWRFYPVPGLGNGYWIGFLDSMDDPNITMDKYIRLEEEKAQKHNKVFNWKTATYGKIWDNEEVHNLGSIETEFPAIVFNDKVSSETLSYKPTVSSLND
nr:hypothetical protein [Tanacetum cinerariifolium]